MQSVILRCRSLALPVSPSALESGTFHYQLSDPSDRPVGTYGFTINKEGSL
jgi:hypothetical protein